MHERDEIILKALEKLVRVPPHIARWTQLRRETGLPAGSLSRRLKSLEKSGEIVHVGKWYTLPKYSREVMGKLLAEKERKLPREHELKIASGLQALTSRGPELLARVEHMEFALQHLYTGYYEEIWKCLDDVKRLREAEAEAVKKLKPLITEMLKKWAIIDQFPDQMLTGLSELLLTVGDKAKDVIRFEPGGREGRSFHRACLGAYGLKELETSEEAEDFRKRLEAFLLELANHPEFKDALKHYKSSSEKHGNAMEKFRGGVNLLAMKLEDGTSGLKGCCELCGDLPRPVKEEVKAVMRILFTCGRIYRST